VIRFRVDDRFIRQNIDPIGTHRLLDLIRVGSTLLILYFACFTR